LQKENAIFKINKTCKRRISFCQQSKKEKGKNVDLKRFSLKLAMNRNWNFNFWKKKGIGSFFKKCINRKSIVI